MGIYVYTLRKNPVIAADDVGDPVSVGYSKYAYKLAWGWDHPTYKRNTARLHSLAEKARAANPDLVLMTFGEPKEHDFAKYGPMPVYQVSPELTSFYDTRPPGKQIGALHKSGTTYIFKRFNQRLLGDPQWVAA